MINLLQRWLTRTNTRSSSSEYYYSRSTGEVCHNTLCYNAVSQPTLFFAIKILQSYSTKMIINACKFVRWVTQSQQWYFFSNFKSCFQILRKFFVYLLRNRNSLKTTAEMCFLTLKQLGRKFYEIKGWNLRLSTTNNAAKNFLAFFFFRLFSIFFHRCCVEHHHVNEQIVNQFFRESA